MYSTEVIKLFQGDKLLKNINKGLCEALDNNLKLKLYIRSIHSYYQK